MSVLHVDLEIPAGKDEAVRGVYASEFSPAISQQPGFESTELLTPAQGRWRLVIRFATERQRMAWVETELHEKVWAALTEHASPAEQTLFEAVRTGEAE